MNEVKGLPPPPRCTRCHKLVAKFARKDGRLLCGKHAGNKRGRRQLPSHKIVREYAARLAARRVLLDGSAAGCRPLLTASPADAPVYHGFLPIWVDPPNEVNVAALQALMKHGYALQLMGQDGYGLPGCNVETIRAAKGGGEPVRVLKKLVLD